MKKLLSFLFVALLIVSLSATCWADALAAAGEAEQSPRQIHASSYGGTYRSTYQSTRPSVLSKVLAAAILGGIVGLINALKGKKAAKKQQPKPAQSESDANKAYICKNCGWTSSHWVQVCPNCGVPDKMDRNKDAASDQNQ